MTDAILITFFSIGVTVLFMLGVPVFLVISTWIVGCSYLLGLTLDNMGAELLNGFNKGFALLAMPLFILTGELINKSGIANLGFNWSAAKRNSTGLHVEYKGS